MKEELSKRNIVLINIRSAEKEGDGTGAGFNELVKKLEHQVSRATVSKALDSLFDMGILDSKWILENGKWKKKVSIANEAKPMVDKMIADLNERGLI